MYNNKTPPMTSYSAPKPDSPNNQTHNDTFTDDPEGPDKTPCPLQSKAQGKRPLSASPAPLPSKRQASSLHKPLSYKDVPQALPMPSSHPPTQLSLTHHTGALFTAPPQTLLLHACNTQGTWGAGIALAFKQAYPKAYAIYHAYCTVEHSFKAGNSVPVGTALLIPPVDKGTPHWIGCLFTSRRYGKGRDGVESIVRSTGTAVEGVLELVRAVNEGVVGDRDKEGIAGVRMCRINSGKFGVEWKRTEEVLRGIVVREGWVGGVEVWDQEGV
ncbi:adp-ribose 1 -phosphate phosphatase [Stemphylium lycopersici]|uniref:ADP-ribose 1''-phosphate phosphatase n=1 Tax=Stemphylium lycopersici TaxID=183478 RepID=A0A364N0R9_STELY|nr:adp-ribose 1 -phosphate phosphatase [Stemphylium lycopersici]